MLVVIAAGNAGARIAVGGKRHALGGTFYEPTILTEVTPEMKVFREETFGPVAPLFRFKTEEDAVKMANDTEFGLTGAVYSRNPKKLQRAAEEFHVPDDQLVVTRVQRHLVRYCVVERFARGSRRRRLRAQRQRQHDATADAAPSACHDRDLAGEPHGDPLDLYSVPRRDT